MEAERFNDQLFIVMFQPSDSSIQQAGRRAVGRLNGAIAGSGTGCGFAIADPALAGKLPPGCLAVAVYARAGINVADHLAAVARAIATVYRIPSSLDYGGRTYAPSGAGHGPVANGPDGRSRTPADRTADDPATVLPGSEGGHRRLRRRGGRSTEAR